MDFSQALPPEIWCDILLLARVPAKTLGQLRCFSKFWNDLIGSSSFIDAHEESEVGKTDLLLVQTGSGWDFSLFCPETNSNKGLHIEFPREELGVTTFSIIGSCKGLLCTSAAFRGSDRFICIWNPTIGKTKRLPQGFIQGGSMGFGFAEKDYKLIKIAFLCSRSTYEAEVYSLGSNSWKRITAIPPVNGSVIFPKASTHIQGKVYWAIRDFSYLCVVYKCILCFDMATETFNIVELKDLSKRLLQNGSSVVSLGVYEQSLSLFHYRAERYDLYLCDIWVCKSGTWEFTYHLRQRISFSLAWPLGGTTFRKFHVGLRKAAGWSGPRLILYDLESRNSVDSEIEVLPFDIIYIDHYQETLMLLN